MATEKKKKSAIKDMAGTVSTAIVIMIVLSIFVLPNFYGNKGTKTLPNEIEAIAKAMESYRSEKGSLPKGTQSEIAASLKDVGLEHERVGKDGRLLDPWDVPFQILASNDGFVIRSAGSNGKFDEGLTKDNDDLFYGSR